MEKTWRFNGFGLRLPFFLLLLCLFNQNFELCHSLNNEGLALLRFKDGIVSDPYGALMDWRQNADEEDQNPCSWFGVGCSHHGKVVTLNLRDLCLGGTLAPEVGSLIHIKSIILRNNSFTGTIPEEIEELKELEVLDLGYNNFAGPVPSDLGSNLSLATLLLDHNRFLGSISTYLRELSLISERQLDKNQLSDATQSSSCNRGPFSWPNEEVGYVSSRRQLQQRIPPRAPGRMPPPAGFTTRRSPTRPSPAIPSPSPSPSFSPSPSPSPSPSSLPSPSPSPSPAPTPDPISPAPTQIPAVSGPPPSNSTTVSSQSPTKNKGGLSRTHKWIIPVVVAGFLVIMLSIALLIFRTKKMVEVKPWATGLSGPLRKAFVTGVPKLNRSELVTACEDFSNVIESSSEGKLYKGTLSSGVEIAVTSTTVLSAKGWSNHLEGHFRKKIDTLSKVNHKNYVNLVGFCEEEEPFTRMMVFEYAPNGTLFEHLHIKEAEHLEWGVRLRIAMGVAYCLEHMHQLTPPVVHNHLNSTAIYLTEDYAAKLSDFSFWNGAAMAKMGSRITEVSDSPSDPENNIYCFGVILLEMITGRLPYADENDDELLDWASDYLTRKEPARYMVDPILEKFDEDELERLCEVIRACLHPDPVQRPTIGEVVGQLRDITGMAPDAASPRASPLWWAELEILSTSN